MASRIEKIALGVISAAWLASGVESCASIYASAESKMTLTQETQHALALEDKLNTSVKVSGILQHPELLGEYAAIQQEYNGLMAKPEVQASLNQSKEYVNAWYNNKELALKSFQFFIGIPLFIGAVAGANRINKYIKNKKEQAKTKAE